MDTLRQSGGLSGFTKRSESEYDPFGAGHSSTSISAALGIRVGQILNNHHDDNHSIAVIGDGAMSAGMAFEAMNNAGAMGHKILVVLNDNDMSIAPPVGAMSNYLSKLIASKPYRSLREMVKGVGLPKPVIHAAKRAEELTRGIMTGGTLFEELGFYYIGPIDGHRIDILVPLLKNFRDTEIDRPVLLHVITQKGKGYAPAEAAEDKFHGVTQFDISTGKPPPPTKTSAPSYTSVFAKTLVKMAETDGKIVAITAAMPSGTGLDLFAKHFPKRFFDVGIAEQHAVTFAAGLATEGLKPFVAIYSTFLQRAFDQVVHDVAIQKLPVRFMIDRAGLVGADGATHAGSFDSIFLGTLPNFVLMAPSDEAELVQMLATANNINDMPSGVRYPRGSGTGAILPTLQPIEIGKGRIIKNGNDVAILSFGAKLHNCMTAAEILQNNHNKTITIADARFMKPLDIDLIRQLTKHHQHLILVEEGSIGGFSSHVLNFLVCNNLYQSLKTITPIFLPDVFLDHAMPDEQTDICGLSADKIFNTVKNILSL